MKIDMSKLIKIIKAIIPTLVIGIIIIYSIVKIVDFHIDGSSIRTGRYMISLSDTKLKLDVLNGDTRNGTNVSFVYPQYETWGEIFQVTYLGNGEYNISYSNDLNDSKLPVVYIAVNNGNVEAQEYTGAANQRWNIKRSGVSQYFHIISVETGEAIYKISYNGISNAIITNLDDRDKNGFNMKFVKQ